MQSFFCKLGLHDYVSIDMTGCFSTTYSDKKWTITHLVWYQVCSCCGKRRMKDNYKKEILWGSTNDKHAGMEYARLGWERYGRMYLGVGKEVTYDPTPTKPKKTKLKIISGGKDG